MSSAYDRALTGYQSGSPRQRLISSLLSAAIILIALLIAIYQTQVAPRIEKKKNPITFDLSGQNADAGAKAPKKQKQADRKQDKKEESKQLPTVAPVPPVVKPRDTQTPAFTFLKMSKEDMAAADIGAMKQSGSGSAGASGGPSGSKYGPGEGPGGTTLYNADWYREPTDAQLGGYLPAKAPQTGWGEIACQTEDHYKVDNCQVLGESPRGSGFGRAVLNAAWQFQVKPPRLNGKPQIGEWVRIRITYGVRITDE
ncbi:hypothetical protein WSK_1322 [Novosphingobium sp. Rr 2-17]|uniref:energy transducer TonB n=1 Tax=Novosphingobium sp. Rr 2-17 TaxID=555793 RepID=UPI00026981B4|nr:energy transducer TonB [Novosphingobium sp. Rr 2-17]EIZ79956.1 hypothetical protein WSK_1322 [Novosphingobium sp. Rr 2-17]